MILLSHKWTLRMHSFITYGDVTITVWTLLWPLKWILLLGFKCMTVGDKNNLTSVFLSNTLFVGLWHFFRQHHLVGVPLEFSSELCGQTEACFSHYMKTTTLNPYYCDSFSLNTEPVCTLMWDNRRIVSFSMSRNTNSKTQQQWLIHTLCSLFLLFCITFLHPKS